IASTFVDGSPKGNAVLGLSKNADASGAFALTGVPAGRYAVVASPATDNQARLGHPPIIDVVDRDVALGDSTHWDLANAPVPVGPALRLDSPGATGPERVEGRPTISWERAQGAAAYRVVVVDAAGSVAWSSDAGADTFSVVYGGPLVPGMWYHAVV